jgi:hypothetical protein
MHKTSTVDYAIVLSDEIWALMDEGETLMRAGDVLVQRATNRAWSNRSSAPCLVAFILVNAKPVSLGVSRMPDHPKLLDVVHRVAEAVRKGGPASWVFSAARVATAARWSASVACRRPSRNPAIRSEADIPGVDITAASPSPSSRASPPLPR